LNYIANFRLLSQVTLASRNHESDKMGIMNYYWRLFST
jgi:hypothetical protein